MKGMSPPCHLITWRNWETMEVGLVVQAAPAVILDLRQVVLLHISNFATSVTVMSYIFGLMFGELIYFSLSA